MPPTYNLLDPPLSFQDPADAHTYYASHLHPQDPDDATLDSPIFDYIWTLGQADIEGGIVLLNHVYLSQLQSQYQ